MTCEDDYDSSDDFEADADDRYCDRCGGEGTIMVCCDDICHGDGECMHGDGEIICPECKGRNLI